tara:strand:- start:521 stop:715 length:195 start_codon:yes stop_codon:yes gene_type:complete
MKSFNTIINEQIRPLKAELSVLKIELKHAKKIYFNDEYEITELKKEIESLNRQIKFFQKSKIKN